MNITPTSGKVSGMSNKDDCAGCGAGRVGVSGRWCVPCETEQMAIAAEHVYHERTS